MQLAIKIENGKVAIGIMQLEDATAGYLCG